MTDEEIMCRVDNEMELKVKYFKLLSIVKRAAKHSCCLCESDCCLACDAKELLMELKEKD